MKTKPESLYSAAAVFYLIKRATLAAGKTTSNPTADDTAIFNTMIKKH